MRIRNFILFGTLAVGCVGTSHAQATSDFVQSGVVSKVAFGSCFNSRGKESSIFDGILGYKPDIFVFLGDNIYGDTEDMEVVRETASDSRGHPHHPPAVFRFSPLRKAWRTGATSLTSKSVSSTS